VGLLTVPPVAASGAVADPCDQHQQGMYYETVFNVSNRYSAMLATQG